VSSFYSPESKVERNTIAVDVAVIVVAVVAQLYFSGT